MIKAVGYYAIIALCPEWVNGSQVYSWYNNKVYIGNKVLDIYEKIPNKKDYIICEITGLNKAEFIVEGK